MNDQHLETLSTDECLARLRAHAVGRVAFVSDDGAPIILPVNYRLVEASDHTWIALRTRPGAQLDRAQLLVAFEIDEVDRVRHEGWSVLVRGTLHHIDADVAAFRERFDPEPWLLEARDSWLIVEPFDITGRALRAAELEWGFDGAAYL
jgi:nitroimidazol reductase NimA-like FMN-containing flavoprotein (pyridoxamine 5'-phosphate oxidase superfamily)